MFVSCSSDETETADADTTDVESTEVDTRSVVNKVSAKAYYYTSLATFKDGFPKESLEKIASLEGKKINLVVLYESDALWAKIFSTEIYKETGSDIFNGLMESYKLKIVQHFTINEDNEGLILKPNTSLENPIEAARKFSLIESVLMVQIKEVPQEEENTKDSTDVN
ncbi:MAG: Unknown protein [uncultured Aureispira sp.]|uniref:Uncharacterized protein n=1 Tax=uncultured Aureispira sp. TaxID=1331704 RepID=A0A6S6TLF0_9BACT|nr:MAG: Unknown protein [uncultured Aureispira sp.]